MHKEKKGREAKAAIKRNREKLKETICREKAPGSRDYNARKLRRQRDTGHFYFLQAVPQECIVTRLTQFYLFTPRLPNTRDSLMFTHYSNGCSKLINSKTKLNDKYFHLSYFGDNYHLNSSMIIIGGISKSDSYVGRV